MPKFTDKIRIAAKRLSGDAAGESGYLYHATNEERAREIAESKLRTHKPWDFTEQDAWPDGSIGKRSYFVGSDNVGNVWQFSPEHGKPVLIRTPHDTGRFKREKYTGDYYSESPVSSSAIEFLGEDDVWYPIKNIKSIAPVAAGLYALRPGNAQAGPTKRNLAALRASEEALEDAYSPADFLLAAATGGGGLLGKLASGLADIGASYGIDRVMNR